VNPEIHALAAEGTVLVRGIERRFPEFFFLADGGIRDNENVGMRASGQNISTSCAAEAAM